MLRYSYDDEDDDDEESENWLASYSDLVTDLMAVFVLLLSFALVVQATRHGNDGGVLEGGPALLDTQLSIVSKYAPEGDRQMDPLDASQIGSDEWAPAVIDPRLAELIESINSYIETESLDDEFSVTWQGDNRILLRVASSVLFDSGKADVRSDTEPILTHIADIFSTYIEDIRMVRIEGHTDNIPISTAQFKSNWELSTARAVNILKHLLQHSDVGAECFSAVGYAEFHPVTDNDSAEGRAQNRRVDFIIETHPRASA